MIITEKQIMKLISVAHFVVKDDSRDNSLRNEIALLLNEINNQQSDEKIEVK